MASNTPNLNLYKKDPTVDGNDTFNIKAMLNDNWDKIDAAVTTKVDKVDFSSHLGDTVYQTAGGTATAITLTISGTLVTGYPITFIASANNNGGATTINNKKLYKPGTTTAPILIAGKAYAVWYNTTGDNGNGCFFIKASAEGNTIASHVLAGDTFSNDVDTGILGTMANHSAETQATGIKALTNLVTNGSFENSAFGWIAGGGASSQVSTTLSYHYQGTTGAFTNANGSGDGYYYQTPTLIESHKYYLCGWMYLTSYASGDKTCLESSVSGVSFDSTKLNQWQFLSTTGTALSSPRHEIRAGHVYSNFAQWQGALDCITLIDLTSSFGAGNEPTQSQMDAIMNTLGGWFDGTCVLAKIPNGAYLNNGITGSPEILTASADLKPSNISSGKNVLGVIGTMELDSIGQTRIVGSSHTTTNAPVDLASIRLEFYNRVYPNNLGAIQVLKDGVTNVFSGAIINTNNTANATDEDSIYITINENMYPNRDYKVVLPQSCIKDKLGNGFNALEYLFHTNPNPSSWVNNPSGLNTARTTSAGCGTQDAGLSFGGNPNNNYSNVTEKFNGNTWNSAGNLNTARDTLAGCGTQDAGLSFGGYNGSYLNITEKFNGSTWSTTGILNTVRRSLAGCGTQNAGLSFGGYYNGSSNITEKFNGASWSTTGILSTGRSELAGCGTQDAGLSFGGAITGSTLSNTEKFNGALWSNTGSLNTARNGLAGCGTQNAGLSFGGTIASTSAITEKFNGVSWSNTGNLNTARYRLAGCGTQSNGLSFGGYVNNSTLTNTEKFFG
ncbi:hypothetical protein [Clostridium aciditolerans]|uniref:hypothetical protein n=1 Tax=Clostridium aciditolerans TaxID=339861 RepID=UPI001FE315D0|nr:hypothetical protein [Clostridium aciditolerans]